MRWVPLAILTYVLALGQTTLGGMIDIHLAKIGPVRPDVLAIVAVYAALNVRSAVDAMLTAWVLGLVVDLTTGAGTSDSTLVGPMALAYALAAGCVYKVRDAVFREKVVTQFTMTVVFCIVAHWLWITAQWMLAFEGTTATGYVLMLVQAVLAGLYTAALAPLVHVGLRAIRRWIIVSPSGELGRRR